ncbi:MAG: NUDIX hydrolase [Blastocatellia bacterium]|nr:NUDIX hydrolase [Blastocatellia bacterium]
MMNDKYPKPSVTADIIIFAVDTDSTIKILLIKRRYDPFKDCWALPGGFLNIDEHIEDTAHRELLEETGLTGIKLHLLGSYSKPGRDPRGRTITFAYMTFLAAIPLSARAADDAADLGWFGLRTLPSLAFDHSNIITDAVADLKNRLLLIINASNYLQNEFKLKDIKDIVSCNF